VDRRLKCLRRRESPCTPTARSALRTKISRCLQSPQTYVYSSYSYLDDLAWAATWLYKATGQQTYLDEAKAYRKRSDFLVESYVNWDAVGPPSAIMMKCMGVAPPEADAHIEKFLADWQKGKYVPWPSSQGDLS
jgi:endoglucanase